MDKPRKRDQVVEIENPLPGSASNMTRLARAQKLVEKRRAIFTGPLRIRFVTSVADEQDRTAMAERALTARMTGRGYDQVRETFFECHRAIPILRPEEMMIARGRASE